MKCGVLSFLWDKSRGCGEINRANLLKGGDDTQRKKGLQVVGCWGCLVGSSSFQVGFPYFLYVFGFKLWSSEAIVSKY